MASSIEWSLPAVNDEPAKPYVAEMVAADLRSRIMNGEVQDGAVQDRETDDLGENRAYER